MPPEPTPRPTVRQQEHIDTLYNIVADREALERTYRNTIVACLNAGLTPSQIEKFAGVNRETVRRNATRHSVLATPPVSTPPDAEAGPT
ncbi:hypothetical protein [Williamsia maris]|uniref:Helix-turn-helix DNA binding domain protein n=1 Tax=Williamsia maris TaxID=72806 RepID=A0ABT1HJD0_9NOCA|nr:hypothetical protein [Williamsia maris]MCP2178029.1 hypothetical protein [Williamsia maris]